MTRKFTIATSHPMHLKLDLEQDLNEQQRAAVTCGDGPKLVIAGAGTGKTRTITYRVAHLISRGVHPSRILLATFTNKAAREMLNRVEALTGSNVGRMWGGTFHSIGNRVLRAHARLVGYEPNYSILDDEDQRGLVKVCTAEAHVKIERERFPSPAVLQEILSFAFNTQQAVPAVIERLYPHFIQWTEAIVGIAERYGRKKREANAMDYDDLLGWWLIVLQQHPEVLRQYGEQFRAILVDEYQDTNTIQAAIVELLASQNGRNLMVVGDDCQSIYAWRGANYDNILHFPDRNPGTEIFKLEINYRSTPQILAFTNASILHNTQQYHKVLRAVRPAGLSPTVVPVNDTYQEAAFLCEQILRLRDEGVNLQEMAVLYRSHAHSTMLQAELVKRNIPYEIRSGIRFFEQAHIKDVVAFLKVLVNPRDEAAWRRLMLMIPKVGLVTTDKIWQALAPHADPLAALAEAGVTAAVPKAALAFWQAFVADMRQLATAVHDGSPTEVISAVMATGYTDYLRAKYESSQSRLEDINQLAIFARQYSDLATLLGELVLLGELYGQEVVTGPTGDAERLVLSTIHQAKGLEWRVVFVPRVAEGSFPAVMALREADGEEEERRIFYVGATRAKDELYLTYPLTDFSGNRSPSLLIQPSRFLQEIPNELYEGGVVEEADEGESASWRD